jgi:hypothetical protein
MGKRHLQSTGHAQTAARRPCPVELPDAAACDCQNFTATAAEL